MSQQHSIQIIRKPELLSRTGYSRSTLHTRISEGLFVPPVSLGQRAVGYLSHEVDQVLAAMIAGRSKDDIRSLVASLIKQRKQAEEALR